MNEILFYIRHTVFWIVFFLCCANGQAKRRAHDSFQNGNFSSYAAITNWMESLASTRPQIAECFKLGATHEGRKIIGIKIGAKRVVDARQTWQPRRAVWIDGGIHANEWDTTLAANYIINELTSKYGVDASITAYVDALDFYITPVVNPDGYDLTHQNFSKAHYWRKNCAHNACKKMRESGTILVCGGVDLNRNFDINWGKDGDCRITDSCSEAYAGVSSFSEPETRAIHNKVVALKDTLDAFITLHMHGNAWTYPYGYTNNTFPEDFRDLEIIGRRAIDAIRRAAGTIYKLGSTGHLFKASAGSSADWVKEKTFIKYVYTVKMNSPTVRATQPANGALAWHVIDIWAGVRVVVAAVINEARTSVVSNTLTPRINYEVKCKKICDEVSALLNKSASANLRDGEPDCRRLFDEVVRFNNAFRSAHECGKRFDLRNNKWLAYIVHNPNVLNEVFDYYFANVFAPFASNCAPATASAVENKYTIHNSPKSTSFHYSISVNSQVSTSVG